MIEAETSLPAEYIHYEPTQMVFSAVTGGIFGWEILPHVLLRSDSVNPLVATAITVIAPVILPPIARFMEKYINVFELSDKLNLLKKLEEGTSFIPGSSENYQKYRDDLDRIFYLKASINKLKIDMRIKGYRHKLWN